MKQDVKKTLEYDRIVAFLREEAGSLAGKELAERLTPTGDLDEARERLEETAQALAVMDAAPPPLGGIRDIRGPVAKAMKDAVLDPEELLEIMSTLYAMRQVKRFFKESGDAAPILKEWAQSIEILGQLERDLENTIDDHGVLRDDATVELARLRQGIRSAQRRVKESLNSILRSTENQKLFQDAIVTMRGDRYVIPVKQEYRQRFPGIVHDQSSTGATLFIEPLAVVNLNNDIKQMTLEEQQEVRRILGRLSARIGREGPVLLANAAILARIDFTFARAKLARRLRATRPELNREGRTVLKQARHPLIPPEQVVPVDIILGEKNRVLLVTGPNTGGKTVAMKTLGLLSLMAQSGCFIPVAAGSELALYQRIYADIGDDQSIEQSLSTFSAHMKYLVGALEEVEAGDLLLLDEIGAGTDPEEGAALAMAILEKLLAVGASVVATTHYPALKIFACTRDGIENACVEFDVETLLPTYRLLFGIPGASNAFAISQRLGLSRSLILRAQELIEADHARFEQVISGLEKEKRLYEQMNAEIGERQRHARNLEEKLAKMKQELTEKKTAILRSARQEGTAMVRQARRESEEIIQALKEQFNDQGIKKRQQAIQEAREKLEEIADDVRPVFSSNPAYKSPVDLARLRVGDSVYVPSLDKKGTVLAIQGKDLELQLGSLKTYVKAKDCRFAAAAPEPADPARRQNASAVFLQKTVAAVREIDIRGLMVDEGEQVVGKFLDDAALAGLKQVLIIHGKGTGALRKGIHAYLRRHRSVRDFNFADIDEGGTGATVVQLKT
ncbi:MAG: endonuclease MutS2 [Schwartzia sp.]|nr:endonuclease MutS2 [Schwartzia sp. (in: firmicutes)]